MKTIAQQLRVTDFPFRIKDKGGNQLYFENSDGDWTKSEYDSEGNEIYYETSHGYWSKKKFDSKGNEIYFEDSRGFWWKCEYDSVGNRIYYEDSSGLIKDNRPKPDDVITIEGIKYKRIEQ